MISELTNTDCFAGNHGGGGSGAKGVGPVKPHPLARGQIKERSRSQEGEARGDDGFIWASSHPYMVKRAFFPLGVCMYVVGNRKQRQDIKRSGEEETQNGLYGDY